MLEFCTVCFEGHIDDVKRLINDGEDDWDRGMLCASQGGHMRIVELMIKHGASDWNSGMARACSGGHTSIINLMIKHGANDWNRGMMNAIRGGHKRIVKLMIEHGANDWNKGLDQAYLHGCTELMELMIIKGADINNINIYIPTRSIERLVKHGIKSFGKYTKIADKIHNKLSQVESVLANKMCKDLAQLCVTY